MPQTYSPIQYRIYLLSVWREGENSQTGELELRFKLEDPRSGEQHGFSDPQALAAYLLASMTQDVDSDFQNQA